VLLYVLNIWNSLKTRTGARLLNNSGFYLYEVANYSKAEPLYKRALQICEKVMGGDKMSTTIL